MTDTNRSDLIEQVSSLSFDDTISRLIAKIAQAGMTLFATIDHAAHARNAGMTMPPATVLIYGSPKGGTPIMLATPLAALDLPLRALVQQRADGKVIIAFHPVAGTLLRFGVPEAVAAGLEPAQRMLVAALAQ